jgi:hypothetical protein
MNPSATIRMVTCVLLLGVSATVVGAATIPPLTVNVQGSMTISIATPTPLTVNVQGPMVISIQVPVPLITPGLITHPLITPKGL